MSLRETDQLARSITSSGVPLPPRLARLQAVRDQLAEALNAAEPASYPFGSSDVTDGDVLEMDPVGVVRLVTEAAEGRARATHLGEAGAYAIERLVDRYEDGIRNHDAGDEIIDAIRPLFEDAAAGLTEAATMLSPDDTSDSILARPDAAEAVSAWQSIGAHRQTLTRIFHGVLVPLVRDFGAAGWHDYMPQVQATAAAFVIDGDHRGNPEGAHYHLGFGGTAHTNPGGGWHRLVNAGWVLRLNTPTEARAICDAHDEARRDGRSEHFKAEAEMQRQVDETYVEIGNP